MKSLYVMFLKVMIPALLVLAAPMSFGQSAPDSGSQEAVEAQNSPDSMGNLGPSKADRAKDFAETVFGDVSQVQTPPVSTSPDTRGSN